MTGLDTNVLVRYMTQDDPDQASLATRLLEREGETFGVCQIVLCELVWVLGRAYGCRREEIARAIRLVLKTAQFRVESPDQVYRALERFENGEGDLSDFLIFERSASMDCDRIATFDRRLQLSPEFVSP